MKKFLILIITFNALLLNAVERQFSDPLFDDFLKEFYDEYICETKHAVAPTGLTSPCGGRIFSPLSSVPIPPPAPPAPPLPSPPAPMANFLPILLTNTTGKPDSDVYVVITGQNTSNDIGVLSIAGGIGTYVLGVSGNTLDTYVYKFSSLPASGANRLIYLPEIISSRFWFSVDAPLKMSFNTTKTGAVGLVEPNFTNPNDPNFNIIFDKAELNFQLTPSVSIFTDATAVDFFSMPIFIYLSSPDVAPQNNTGLTYARSTAMGYLEEVLNFPNEPEKDQWNNLVIRDAGGTPLRVASTQNAISAPKDPSNPSLGQIFDPNYLDNLGAYGYSYLNNIWENTTSFYRKNQLRMVGYNSGETYIGTVQGDNSIIFNSTSSSKTVTFDPPTTGPTPVDTTSFKIFGGKPLFTTDTTGVGDAVQLSKLFEECIITGLIPTTDTISLQYLINKQADYYKINSSLTSNGQMSGPWYDVYSQGLHNLGLIYAYAYDDAFWIQVQIHSETLSPTTFVNFVLNPLN
ncbi:MAG: hypothetical protein KDK96_03885 [Chlamydiia bacterium]|nr:hypothetical protein [Chlamydiia bacterium]